MEEGGDDSIEASSSSDKDAEIALADGKQTESVISRHSWSRLLLHASIMCGREFLYAVEIVLVTPIILQLGMPPSYYSFMWCFSPFIGVLVGPILGTASDRCTSRFGRRRPFIVGLVSGAIVGLTLLIFSKDIAHVLGGTNSESRRLWGVVVGVLGAQSMDFCLDQAETPLRAYTLDVCNPSDQQRAFALQTVFIGIGGALGFIVDGIDWEQTPISYYFGSQIKVVYIFAIVAYLVTTVCNLVSFKERIWKKRLASSSTVAPTKSHASPQAPDVNAQRKLRDFTIAEKKRTGRPSNGSPQVMSMVKKSAEDFHVSYSTADAMLRERQDLLHDNLVVQRQGRGRHLTILPHISFNKGLYISTSCPGGLNEYCDSSADSSSSLDSADSAYEEESILPSSALDELKAEDVSLSLPALNSGTPFKGKGNLLDFIRSKEFTRQTALADGTVAQTGPGSDESDDASKRSVSRSVDRNRNELENGGNALEDFRNVKSSDKARTAIRKLDVFEPSESPEIESKSGRKQNRKKRRKKTEQAACEGEHPISMRQLWLSIVTMPSQLRWLCIAQLLGFVGMETILLWYTDLMGRVVYGGDPQASSNSTELATYNAGVKMGCWGLTVYSLAMVIFSAAMEKFRLLTKIRLRTIYSFSFLLLVVTTVIMFFATTTEVVIGLSWCVGVTFAIMLTVPYVLVGKYHQIKQYVAKSPGSTKRGFGLDCAILACQMYIGNIVSASISSPIIWLSGTVRAMLLTTGFCHLVAFIFAYFFVCYPDETGNWCAKRRSTT